MRLTNIICLQIFFQVAILIESDTMNFTPDHPLCTGDTVHMVCLITVPLNSTGVFSSAQISINGSEATFPTLLGLLSNVDTSRYVGDYRGLNITVEKPGAWLNISYIPIDSSIVFGCHAYLDTEKSTEALVTGQMHRPAVPPTITTPTLSLSSIFPHSCTNTQLSWLPAVSERTLDAYTIYRNGEQLVTVGHDVTSYTDNTVLALNEQYIYSVVASSCAGNSTHGYSDRVNVSAYSIVNNSLNIEYDINTHVLNIKWNLSNTQPSPPLLSLTYILHINYSYIREKQNNSHITLFSLLSNDTAVSRTLSLLTSLQGEIPDTITASIKLVRQCGQKWPVDTDGMDTQTTMKTTTITTDSTHTTPTPVVEATSAATTTTTTTTTNYFLLFIYMLYFISLYF